MIIGEHNRAEDLEVNIVREKHLTNIAPRPPTSWSG